MNEVCSNCKWLEVVPFGEKACANPNKDFEYSCEDIDTCSEFEEKED